MSKSLDDRVAPAPINRPAEVPDLTPLKLTATDAEASRPCGGGVARLRIQRVLLVLPALNEAGKIGRTIRKVPPGVVDDILVVDDFSTDGTGDESAALGALVIRHERNLGVGAAIRTGIHYAAAHDYDVVVVAASDDQDVPTEISRLLEPIDQGRAEFVQGSRYLRGGRRVRHPLSRTIMTWGYSVIFTVLALRRVTDGTNGFRAFRTQTAMDLPLDQEWLNRYELEPYLYWRCLQRGVAIEVPVTKEYPAERTVGYTKMRPVRDWWRIFRPLLLLRLGLRH